MNGPQFIATAAICFLIIASILITLHELGHYTAARVFGLKAKAFSFGFGPELIGVTDKYGTRWKICPIPLGGYCSFHGEMHPNSGSDEEAAHDASFAKLARWKRAIIVFAGPFVNVLICAAVMGGLFAVYGEPQLSSLIKDVTPGSPAAVAGIRTGDRIMSWNGNRPNGDQSLLRYIKLNPDTDLTVVVARHGQQPTLHHIHIARAHTVDRFGNKADIGRVGVLFDTFLQPIRNPLVLAGHAARESLNMFVVQAKTIAQFVEGRRSVDELAGPVRLAKTAAEQYLKGWTALVYFTGVLSIAVAFMNLLPIPGLDGGLLALYAIEGVMGHDLSRKVFARVLKTGYACVVVLMVFAFSNDFRVLLVGG